MFHQPQPLDLTQTITEKTPDDWLPYLQGKEKEQLTFLPLADGDQRRMSSGWCTYAEHIGDAPDVEILCGGMNHKLPSAAAVWRQGDLLHFGFEESPDQLNANGRKLLANCVAYIAGFTADRPLANTPSPFVERDYPKPRRYTASALRQPGADPAAIAKGFVEPWCTQLTSLDLVAFRSWYAANADFVCAADAGKLMLDETAKRLAMPIGKPEFWTKAKATLADQATRDDAVAVLARRVAAGPGARASAAAWLQFVTDNERYLFFVEEGGQQWHLDPLAKARGVACADLRGPARAGN